MAIGIVGRKVGMTRVFTEAGESIPVTVIECAPNRVAQVKTPAVDGYAAVQVVFGQVKQGRLNKPAIGHFKKSGVAAGKIVREFRMEASASALPELGSELHVDAFADVKHVDVTGISRGKGFAGVQKRWNFGGGRATHGASLVHRMPGSIGQRQTPGKVWKGHKMAGHMGNSRVTALNLDLVKVDAERNLLLVRGAVPGQTGGAVLVRPAVKTKARS